jgi:DNA-directed RNA polymerase subunit RPC12/RpoP
MSNQIIDVQVISETPAPKLLPSIPMSMVCSSCKQETGFTKEDIMKTVLIHSIKCPNCDTIIISCKPETNSYKGFGSSNSNNNYNSYGYPDWDGD